MRGLLLLSWICACTVAVASDRPAPIDRGDPPPVVDMVVQAGRLRSVPRVTPVVVSVTTHGPCEAVVHRLQPTTSLGFGVRLDLSSNVAFRVDVRKVLWIELVEGRYLEARSPTLAQASTTFSLRKRPRRSAD